VVVIEHNLDIIKSADRLIDMGPEGGEEGGMAIAVGTPEEVAAEQASHTGQFLAALLTPAASPNGKANAGTRGSAGKRKPRTKVAA
jgi:excinuclease ABC subunit A